MRQVWLVFGAIILMGAAGAIVLWQGAREEEPTAASFAFQDWSVRCQVVSGASGCGLTQQVVDARLGGPVLQLTMVATPSGKGKLAIVVPLGVSVPDGVTLQVGDLTRRLDYAQCLSGGCVALLDADGELIDKMKAGGDTRVGVVDRTGAPVAVPVSLKGFAPAYEKMRSKSGGGSGAAWWTAWINK